MFFSVGYNVLTINRTLCVYKFSVTKSIRNEEWKAINVWEKNENVKSKYNVHYLLIILYLLEPLENPTQRQNKNDKLFVTIWPANREEFVH